MFPWLALRSVDEERGILQPSGEEVKDRPDRFAEVAVSPNLDAAILGRIRDLRPEAAVEDEGGSLRSASRAPFADRKGWL